MMCCRLMPCKNGKNFYIYKNTKLAEGTVADEYSFWDDDLEKLYATCFPYMNSKRGSSEIFFRYFFLSDIQIVDRRKDKIKFNEIWHRMNRVKGGSFNSKGKTGIFLTVQTWQLWVTSWMHFFIWRADIGIYCCSGLSSKTATKLHKKKKDDKF